MNVPTSEHILSTERLEALADSIFAFDMTLLVLSIDIPVSLPTASANQAILKYIIVLMPKLGIYVIAFLNNALSFSGFITYCMVCMDA